MLDVRGAYNLIRIAEGEEVKTAFCKCYGLSESGDAARLDRFTRFFSTLYY